MAQTNAKTRKEQKQSRKGGSMKEVLVGHFISPGMELLLHLQDQKFWLAVPTASRNGFQAMVVKGPRKMFTYHLMDQTVHFRVKS